MCQHGSTVVLTINGKLAGIDACISPLVFALNATGFRTIASCCGHGHRPGVIVLADGRELFILPDSTAARQLDVLIGVDIHGEPLPQATPARERA